ncbi:MAG: hypothetical protein M1368_07345, partial [Thaumarchaeota archaeon]|nr:hypothetical protein [Nitrososphaerota archaeon]
MAKIRIPKILQTDSSVVKPAFSGYVVWALIILAALSLAIFFLKNPVVFSTMQLIIIYSCMALSYDYFSGYSGYYNLGFGAFIGLGAYIFIFTTNAYATTSVPIYNDAIIFLAFILSGGLAALFGIGMSYPEY